ncbi:MULTISPECIES: hypothetical protein [unclassified Microbacterium]
MTRNPLYADSVSASEEQYRSSNDGEDPWNLAELGGQVIDHQVYSGVEH